MDSKPPSFKNSSNRSVSSQSIPGESRRQRRREKRGEQTDNVAPVASGSSSPWNKPRELDNIEKFNAPSTQTFTGDEDFIPFSFSVIEEDEVLIPPRDRDINKGHRPSSLLDKGKGRADTDRPPTHEREWDRGKRGHSRERDTDRSRRKRKHDRILEDDTPSKRGRWEASVRGAPWIRGLDFDRCMNVAEILHEEVKGFLEWISPTNEEHEIRGLIVKLITETIQQSFPDAQILPFGSYETKLYLPSGDIDLVILSDSMAYSNKNTVLHAIARTLKYAGITSNVTIVAKAKVPIVKFITAFGRFNVDISINQNNGLVSGKIINGFLKDMHGSGEHGRGSIALRSLVLVTKAFLSQRNMNEVFTGGLGSYSIVCLAVSFLQMHPKIRRGEIDVDKNLGVLVMEFFELYGCFFNYDEAGISLRDGGTYFSKKSKGWYDFSRRYLLSIEDPADPSNDISKGSYGIQNVRTTFAGAFGILTSTAYLKAGIISARREDRFVPLRGRFQPEDLSILSSIMGITQETINHRKIIEELYDSRALHKVLGIKITPAVVNGDYTSGSANGAKASSRVNRESSVRNAWKEAEGASDDEYRHRHRQEPKIEDDEGGRYEIGRSLPPRKRRRMGRQEDKHTVFIPDDDDDGHNTSEEELHYVSDTSRANRRERYNPVNEKRRSYWLSKGIGLGGLHGAEDDSV